MALIDEIIEATADAALADRLRFVLEIDRLKAINRRTRVGDLSRFENSAEHSWHLAMIALVLAPHADDEIDLDQVIRLLLVHDLVEIDADDTFLYDTAGRKTKAAQEQAAAERLYGLLPDADGHALRSLWDEFEARETPEARFAAACDRLQPLLLNLMANGRTWNEHGIEPERVYAANAHIEAGSTALWDLARGALDRAVDAGVLSGRREPPLAVIDGLTIRSATLQDVNRVVEIENSPEHAGVLGRWEPTRHQAAIGDPDRLHLVFERDDEVVGYAILAGIDRPVVELERMAVATKRQGVGRLMLRTIIDEVLGRGARKLLLDVVATNLPARHLYESEGFVVEGVLCQQADLDGQVVDLVLMARFPGA